MADFNNVRYFNEYYEEGSALRKVQPAYEPEVERPEVERPKVDPKRQERIRKNRERYNVIDLKYTLLVACSVAIIMAACVGYLRVQASIASTRVEISSLQKEYQEITNENIAKSEVLNASVDLDSIYNRASKELGMKYADANHTILYQSSDPDYVRQFQDIPASK
ncbi:MAG: hypothetical protein K5656_01340 [Lachnospiraceae bacterium]|nr:hypothetical protein [Lachnospiraceae bacterium]